MKVSIFTPAHITRYIETAYESIKDQSFDEWLVVLNGEAKAVDFGDKRVRYVQLNDAIPKWVGALKRTCCSEATGDILVELDSDDSLLPSCIDEVRKAFEDPEIGFVYSNSVHVNGEGKQMPRFGDGFGWEYQHNEATGLEEVITFDPTPASVSRIWFAPNHVRCFRRSVYEEVGGYNPEMRILDDQDLMSRLYCRTKFFHINKGLYLYRIHGENTWLKYNQEIQSNVMRIYNQYIASMVLKWAADNQLSALDLGGAHRAEVGFTTVDKSNADVIADLDGPWPFEDNSVGIIRAVDILEHLKDPIHTMQEMSRVLAPGGWVMIRVPSTDGRGAFQDPTHKTFWNENSFRYYTHEEQAAFIGTPVRFQPTQCFTTPKNQIGVCWVHAHLINLKGGYKPPGQILI